MPKITRGYVFIEKARDEQRGFWSLGNDVRECAGHEHLGIVRSDWLWGQYDMLIVIQRDNLAGLHNSISNLQRLPGTDRVKPSIADSTTMVAVDPDPNVRFSEPSAVLAVDTLFGHEQQVAQAFRDQREVPNSPVMSADVVLGDHDVIVLINGGVQRRVFSEFLSDHVDQLSGITKTRTMFTCPLPRGHG